MKYSQVQALMQSEVRLLRLALKRWGQPSTTLRNNLEDYVQRVTSLHMNLIARWGGYHFHGPGVGGEDELSDGARGVVENLYDKLTQAVNGEFTPNLVLHRGGVGGFRHEFHQVLAHRTIQGQYNGAVLDFDKKHVLSLGAGSKVLQCSVRVGERVSAAIMDVVESTKNTVLIAAFTKLFQELGEQVWAAQRSQFATTLSCSPTAFMSLGQGKHDSSSCFKNGHNDYCKIYLAADIPDSIAVFFYRGDNVKLKGRGTTVRRTGKPVGRAFGVFTPEGALVTNYYGVNANTVEGSLCAALSAAMGATKNAMKGKVLSVEAHKAIRRRESFYLNGDAHLWVFGKSAKKDSSAYLQEVFDYAGKEGLYAAGGRGRGEEELFDVQLVGGRYVVKKKKPKEPDVPPPFWPYARSDGALALIAKDGTEFVLEARSAVDDVEHIIAGRAL